jgi:hypothetical protein
MDRVIYCLAITTERREHFKEWLLWNYYKQTYLEKRLIVLSDHDRWPPDVISIKMRGNIPKKRNAALSAITGCLGATWFDDDDWQHEDKCALIADGLNDGYDVVGSNMGMFYDLVTKKGDFYFSDKLPIFNSVGFRPDKLPRFDEREPVASDTTWLIKLLKDKRFGFIPELLTWWLVHEQNISNPARKIDAKLGITGMDKNAWLHLKKLEQHGTRNSRNSNK